MARATHPLYPSARPNAVARASRGCGGLGRAWAGSLRSAKKEKKQPLV